jgi:hypothetical protein
MSVGPFEALLTVIFMAAKNEAKAVDKNETHTEYTLCLVNFSRRLAFHDT